MDYESFNQIIVSHRNSIIFIGISVLIFVIIGIVAVEIYVRGNLNFQYIKFNKLKFSPTLLMLIPLILVIVYFPIKIYQCNYDIDNLSYESYVGEVEYSESSVKLVDDKLSVFVGKYHEIVPQGITYGLVIYSEKSHVIVFYEAQN